MLVAYAWCPTHGQRDTAILGAAGLRRCDARVADGCFCRQLLRTAPDAELDPSQTVIASLEEWADDD